MKPYLLNKKYKKQFLELKFLYAELEYYEDSLKEAQKDFKEAFYKRSEETNIKVNKPEIKQYDGSTEIGFILNNIDIFIEQQPTNDKDEDLSKLYKKIATITHPDTIPVYEKQEIKQKKLEQFLEAQEAYKNKNWYVLCMLALDLGLEIPEPKKYHIEWLDEEANRVKKRIEFIKTTYAWVWYNEEQNENKNKLMDQYLSIVVK